MDFNLLEDNFLTDRIDLLNTFIMEIYKKMVGETENKKYFNSKSLLTSNRTFSFKTKPTTNNNLMRTNSMKLPNNNQIKNINNNNKNNTSNNNIFNYFKKETNKTNDEVYSCNNVFHQIDISTAHLILKLMNSYKEDPLKLEREWINLSTYKPEEDDFSISLLEENIYKNFNKLVLPYNKNRFKLNKKNNCKKFDYINASKIFVRNPIHPSYIITQSPLPHTTSHFWQMVWESNSKDIINLTSFSDKTFSYWSETGSKSFNNLKVSVLSQHFLHPDFYIRNILLSTHTFHSSSFSCSSSSSSPSFSPPSSSLNLSSSPSPSSSPFSSTSSSSSSSSSSPSRIVTMFHYHSWKKNSIPPTSQSLLTFINKVNKYNRSKFQPLIVHCSDGSDRSGVYLLIDSFINKFNLRVEEVDLEGSLENIKDQRMGTIANKEQYEFILKTIAEHICTSLTKPCLFK